MDVALVLDTTTSMDPAIDAVKAGVDQFVAQIESVSQGDYRLGLVDFGVGVTVHTPFADRNADQIRAALPDLRQDGGNAGDPEASDVALQTVITNRSAADVPDNGQEGDFTVPWRTNVTRIAVLVTDARPAGLDDDFDAGVDDETLWATASSAAASGIVVGAILVPNVNHEPEAAPVLQEAARRGGGPYFSTLEDGANLADGLDLLVTACGADADGDGLFDSWEVSGYDADGDGIPEVDLPAMGANPQHKDLFLHIAWMSPDEVVPCYRVVFCPGAPDGSHPPDVQALERVVKAFANAPVDNPDSETGIAVHVDAGPMSPSADLGGIPTALRQGGPIPVHEDVLFADENRGPAPFSELRAEYLPPGREPLFTFVLYAHHLIEACNPLVEALRLCGDWHGWSHGIPGDGVVIADRTIGSTGLEAAVLMHELGHTLGLRHGGGDDVIGKPNYLSVMNYSFMWREGLITDDSNGVLDYSRWELGALDERGSLDEALGIQPVDGQLFPDGYWTIRYCNGSRRGEDPEPIVGPKNWNCRGASDDIAVSAPIHRLEDDPANYEGLVTCSEVDNNGLQELCSQNDWQSLVFTGGIRGGAESEVELIPDGEALLTPEEYLATPKPYALLLLGGGDLTAPPGALNLQVVLGVDNVGQEDDTYEVDVSADADWGRTDLGHSNEVEVASGDEALLTVALDIPEDADEGETVQLIVRLQSEAAAHVSAEAPLTITVDADASPVVRSGELEVIGSPAHPGDEVEASGAGFAPDAIVATWLDDEERLLAHSRADEAGQLTAQLTVPDLAPGTYTVIAMGERGAGSAFQMLRGELRISAASNTRPRDERGAPSTFQWRWVLVGLVGLVVVGTVLLILRKARRT